jgi:hypothetical protein
MDVRGSDLYIVVLHGPVSYRAHADSLNRSLAPSRRDLSHKLFDAETFHLWHSALQLIHSKSEVLPFGDRGTECLAGKFRYFRKS